MSAPERIGRYRIDRRLGSGGFATVWLARDEVLDAPVAVKVLADNWAHRLDVRERFLEEARILRRADSDRVVRVHDIGELADGRPYFVMTYADGGTLADKVAAGPVRLPDALRYGADVARGLAVLHEVGVIHRDVNPANVLLRSGRDGFADRVLVADLGLAKAAAHASGFTLTVGTPGYMAPEQSSGDGLSKRADVYAVGALLHHLISGVAPVADKPLPPLPPDVPDAVDAVVRQAVRRRPEERYPSAGALADALDAAAIASSGGPRSGSHPAIAPESGPPHRSRPEGASAAGAEPGDRVAQPDDTMLLRRPVQRGPVQRGPVQRGPVQRGPAAGRRRRGGLLVVFGVVLLLLAGGAGVLAWRLRTAPDVRVQGASATVTVPRAWAAERQDGTSAGSAVLLVATSVAGWADTSSATPGVRVAVGPPGAKEADLLAGLAPTGCQRTDTPWDTGGLRGTVHYYVGCPGVRTDLVQAVLTATDARVVFVQIRDTSNAASAVLRSITLR